MKSKYYFILFIVHMFIFSSFSAMAGEVHLSVASSMTDTVRELVNAFTKENPKVSILPNFASSGSLAKQIAQGAPADLYISANQKWMDFLLERKHIARETAYVFAYNELVFVGVNNSKINSLNDIVSLSRISMGSPKSVPAGMYAAQAMKAAGIYKQLEYEHKLVIAKDVRQALIYADRTEVDGAFVYRTDALLAKNTDILFTVPSRLHDRITYPLGLTPSGVKNSYALAFSNYLKSHDAITILKKYGFKTNAEN